MTWKGAMREGVWARSRIVEDGGVGEVEVVEGEVAGVGRGEGGEDALAAALVEEGLVAEEDVAGAECGRGDLGEEAVGGGESSAARSGSSEGLQHIADEGLGEVAGDAVYRGGSLPG